MGFIDFIKDAGEKVFGVFGNKEEVKKEAEQKKISVHAAELLHHLKNIGLETSHLTISVTGDVATLGGEVSSQEMAEKLLIAAGNVSGISKVENKMTIKKLAPEAKYHTVVAGDTLSKISKQYYGDAMKYNIIFEANKPML
ncbi:MAG: peptidoglycan-binding protein LysM, partial [Flammeovirgaceae bacterium]|nr:peptidoglycan-binding protein LysM [Flammeovirgaceae bacterium]